MRKVFLEDLPHKKNRGKSCIDWVNSPGYNVRFEYDSIVGSLKIIKIENYKITVEYNGNIHTITRKGFVDCGLAKIVGKINKDFKYDIGTVFSDNRRNIVIIGLDKKDGRKGYYYKCNVCGWRKGWIIESNLKQGGGCSCCGGITIVKGINDVATTNSEIFKFLKNKDDAFKYSKGSHVKVEVVCPNCGALSSNKMAIKDIVRRKRVPCKCNGGFTYPERLMMSVLKALNIDFIKELTNTTFEWCGGYRYDFYIPDKNLIIEVHGKQHYDGGFSRCGTGIRGKNLMEEQANDMAKMELAMNNGVSNYVVIDARESSLEWIKNSIIKSKIGDIYNISDINWLKCDESASTGLVKDICDYYMENNKPSSKEIALKFNTTPRTVVIYLNKGALFGWCDYSGNEVAIKTRTINLEKARLGRLKKVDMFSGDEFLGSFESATYLEGISEEKFGVKLYSRSISSVCRGEIKTHKGYTFKYVD